MRLRRIVRPLLIALLMVMAAVATAQDDGTTEQKTTSEEDPERGIRMSIVHKGPGRSGDGLAALFPDQVRELEAEDKSFSALFLAHETPEQKGGAVIIPDTGQSPAYGLSAGLRRALPESGWSTLAIGLPPSMVEPLPERVFGTRSDEAEDSPESQTDGQEADDGSQSEENGNGDEARSMTIEVTQGQREGAIGDERESWQEAEMARLGAAVQTMRNQGIQNIVLVGMGEGADLALRYVEANAATFRPGGIGLVWLDARFRPPYEQPLDEVLGDGYAVPVLDLYDRDRSGKRSPDRQAAAQRGGFENYTQSALPMPRQSRDAANRRLGAWVAGWLNENMVGTETQ